MDEKEGRAPSAPPAAILPSPRGEAEQAARRQRRMVIAMAAVAGALSVGLALLRIVT